MNLDGKVAIVTGASRGVGAATAAALAARGCKVVCAARATADAPLPIPGTIDDTVAQINEAGGEAVAVPTNLADAAAVEHMVATTVERWGRVDVLVNNAAITFPGDLDLTMKRFDLVMQVDLRAPLIAIRAVMDGMKERGEGAIVNISSTMGRLRDRGMLAYGTAKGALSHMTRLMAADLAPKVRVNAIAVGSVATSALQIVLDDDSIREEMIRRTPLKRLGEPDDIAFAALYLASPAGSFVTGKVFEVDGGLEEPNLELGMPDL